VSQVVVMLLLSVLMNTVAQLCLKRGVMALRGRSRQTRLHPITLVRFLMNPFMLLWIVLLVPSLFLWLKAISLTELSFAYPFLSLSLVFIILGSIAFLKEQVTTKQWTGIILITFGIILISGS
jgi:drug/metabolite transporter (DMT)-like permease